jgi:beta-lactamase class A
LSAEFNYCWASLPQLRMNKSPGNRQPQGLRKSSENAAIKRDEHDTTTPAAMLNDVKSLLLGETLSAAGRQRLGDWLIKNTTGDKRLRAGLPSTWQVGDKAGTGDNGARGDVAIARPPNRQPILIVVYTVESHAPDDKINEAFAAIGKLVAEEFSHAKIR